MGNVTLSERKIAAMKPNTWLADAAVRGAGGLVFYSSRAGKITAFFRHTTTQGKTDRLALGAYDPSGRSGLRLVEMREKAGELSKLYQTGIKDLRAHFEEQARLIAEAEETARLAQEATRQAAEREAMERERYTLSALLRAYADHLERQGKIGSAKAVRSLLKVHLETPAPDLAKTPAREVTKAALATRLREIREGGKERTAGILRSYLHSAYALAQRAEGDTQAPAALIRFGIETNPLIGIRAIPVRPGERALSREELRAFLGKLGQSLADQALKLVLYSGGQRSEQLLRARVSDFDPATGILRLLDPKGRRQIPREHRLPLGPVAAALVKDLVARARQEQPEALDPPLFASGKVALVRFTLTHRVGEIAAAMGGAPFILRDLRRTVETEMAGLGFSTDLRAQLLSHGISGVQATHYDRHSYLAEKQAALEAWERHLEGQEQTAAVVSIATRRRAA